MHIVPSQVCYSKPSEIAQARRSLWQVWGIPTPRKENSNPGAQPISLHRNELQDILARKNDFCVSLKADGVRYLLLLTTEKKSDGVVENVALMFDRKLLPFEISLWAPAHLFEKGSLFDGELVERKDGKNKLDFLVFDVMTVAGDCVGQRASYLERFGTVHSLFDRARAYPKMSSDIAEELVLHHSQVVVVNHDCDLQIQSKKITDTENIRKMWFERQSAGFRQDGIIFTDVTKPVGVGRNYSQFKWKAVHTIDVMLRAENGCYNVYVDHGNRHILVSREAVLCVKYNTGTKTRVVCKVVHNLILKQFDVQSHTTRIVECTMDLQEASNTLLLFPVMIRHDKGTPNQLTTVESTIENVLEHIGIEELLDNFSIDTY